MTTTRQRIPRLGLTGGIGSGKSTALAYLHECGAAVVSSDDIVHGLYDRPAIIAAVQGRYGQKALTGAHVNRQALAGIVFRDQDELQWLERLLHPHVHAAMEKWATAQQKVRPRPAVIVAEVPLLFETGMETAFDFVMLITAPVEVRRRRLTDKLTDSEFERRMAQQMPEDEKIARSDFVFHNSGERKALREFVGQTVAQIIAGVDAAAGGGAGESTP
jgi:dephospho-CoA kinase